MANTDYYAMTDEALAKELGNRLKERRLQKNISQGKLAELSGLSINAIKSLEKGRATMPTLIAVLRVLEGLDELMSLLELSPVQPMELLRRKGKQRQRARPVAVKTTGKEDSSW